MIKRLTKRYLVHNIDNLNLSAKIRYERYYISDKLRIQKKGNILEKEILDDNNIVIYKVKISKEEFLTLREESYSQIIRDSYLYLDDSRVSIKKYYDKYDGLIRVEVKFSSKEEMDSYKKEDWMGTDITDSPLAFDKYLSKMDRQQFLEELKKSENRINL